MKVKRVGGGGRRWCKRRDKWRDKRRGFVLLEVVLAVSIFSIAVVSLTKAFQSVLAFSSFERRESALREELRNQFALIKAEAYLEEGTTQEDVRGGVMRVERTVEEMNLNNQDGEGVHGLWKVQVEVFWNGSEHQAGGELIVYRQVFVF